MKASKIVRAKWLVELHVSDVHLVDDPKKTIILVFAKYRQIRQICLILLKCLVFYMKHLKMSLNVLNVDLGIPELYKFLKFKIWYI